MQRGGRDYDGARGAGRRPRPFSLYGAMVTLPFASSEIITRLSGTHMVTPPLLAAETSSPSPLACGLSHAQFRDTS